MADYSRAQWDRQSVNPAQPSGLTDLQTSTGAAYDKEVEDGGNGFVAWHPEGDWAAEGKGWIGGQNLHSTTNGWNTAFMQEALRQRDKYMDQAAASGRSTDYFKWLDTSQNRMATGVALWDDEKRGIRRGDVFSNGQKQEGGNLYQIYSQRDADLLMGEFLFDGKQKATFNADRNPAERYRKAVQQQTDEWSNWANNAETAQKFDDETRDTNQRIRESWGGLQDDVIAGGAGFLGGALTFGAIGTAVAGPVGGVIGVVGGGIIGGVSSWLNRDQFTEVAARATQITDRAMRDHGTWEGILQGTSEFSKLVMMGQNPINNTFQGIYDGVEGDIGDGISEYYELDSEGNAKPGFFMKALNLSSVAGDAFLQFSNPVSAGLYLTTMGVSSISGAAFQIATDSVWSDSEGQFHNLSGWKEHVSAAGEASIDLAQVGIAGAMTKAAAASRAAFAEGGAVAKPIAPIGLEAWGDKAYLKLRGINPEGVSARTVNATRFYVEDATQKVVSSRLTMQMIAPSEMLRWLPTGWRARNIMASGQGTPTVDDLYHAAIELAGSGGRIQQGFLTAFVEGGEEAAQAWLHPMATGDSGHFADVWNAALMGGAAGFGMGVSRQTQGAQMQQVERFAGELYYRQRNNVMSEEQLSSKEFDGIWKALTPAERKRMALAQMNESEDMSDVLKTAEEWHTASEQVNSAVGIATLSQANLTAFERDHADVNPNLDASFQIKGMSGDKMMNPDGSVSDAYPANAGVMSAFSMVKTIDDVHRGLKVIIEDIARRKAETNAAIDAILNGNTPSGVASLEDLRAALTRIEEEEADMAGQLAVSEQISAWFLQMYNRLRDTTDNATAKALIKEMNDRARLAWRGRWDNLPATASEDIRRAVEFKASRHPNIDTGSFVILLPQISEELTARNAHNQLFVHQAILKAPNADFDGDTMVGHKVKYLPPAELKALRGGSAYMEEVGTRAWFEAQGYEADEITDEMLEHATVRWVVVMDAPTDERAYIEAFSQAWRDKKDIRHTNVKKGFDNLSEWFLGYGRDRGGPLDSKGVQDALDQFKKDVQANREDARIRLINNMFNIDAQSHTQLRAMGMVSGEPEMLRMTRRISEEWDVMQTDNAALAYAEEPNAHPASPQREKKERAWLEVREATASAAVGHAISRLFGQDPVRASQHMHYTSFLHAAINTLQRDQTGWVGNTAQKFSEAYMEMGSGDTKSDTDKILGRNAIEDRVLFWLSEMAKSVPEISGIPKEYSTPQMMLVLAQTAVRDIEIDPQTGEPSVTDGEITLLQMLLRKSLQIERNKERKAAPDDPIMLKIKRLERFTRAQEEHSYSASLAMLEIFGGFQLHQILGKSAQFLGPQLTLNQLKRGLDAVHERTRETQLAHYREVSPAYQSHIGLGDPPFSAEVYEKGEVNGYTVIVDALTAVSRNNYKVMKAQDKVVHGQVIKGFSDLENILITWREKFGGQLVEPGEEVTDLLLLRDMLEKNPEIAAQVAEIIPEASRLGTFTIENGRVYMARWVEEMLLAAAEGKPERAATIYFVHSKWDEFNALGGRTKDLTRIRAELIKDLREQDAKLVKETGKKPMTDAEIDQAISDGGTIGTVRFGRIKSRYLQTLYHLAAQPDGFELDRFIRASQEAQTLEALFDQINNEPMWRNDREKLLPWHDDVALFEVDPKDVWQANLPGTLQREAIQGWGSRIEVMGSAAVSAVVNKGVKADVLSVMDALMRSDEIAEANAIMSDPARIPTDPVERSRVAALAAEKVPVLGRDVAAKDRKNGRLYLEQFKKALENATLFPDGIGPMAREQFMTALLNGFVQMHNKGTADDRVAPMGEGLVTADQQGLKQGPFLELDALMSMDFDDIRTNLTKLAEGPQQIMFNDGRMITIDMSNPRAALNMLMDDRTTAFAEAVLFPTNRDVNPNNIVQIYSDSDNPSSFIEMLEDASFVKLVQGDGRPSLRHAYRYIDRLESFIRKGAESGSESEKKAAYFPIQHMLDDFLAAYQSVPGWETMDQEAVKQQLVVEVAYAIQQLAKVDEGSLPQLKLDIRDAMSDRFTGLSTVGDNDPDPVLNRFTDTVMKKLLHDKFSNDHDEIMNKQQQTLLTAQEYDLLTPEQKDKYDRQQAKLTKKRAKVDKILSDIASGDPFALPKEERRDVQMALEMFTVDHKSKKQSDIHDKKKMLYRYLKNYNRLNQYQDKKTMNLIHKVRSLVDGDQTTLYDTKAITDEEWDTLTTWAATSFIAEQFARPGSSVALAPLSMDPDAEVNRLYDWTFGYLTDGLFDTNILKAARFIKVRANDNGDVTDVDAAKLLLTGVLNEKKLGTWNDRIPIESLKFRKILNNSNVGLAVPVAGNDPKTLADYVAAGFVGFEEPLPTHLSIDNSIKGKTYRDASGRLVAPKIADILRPTPNKLIKLQNHFVSSIKLTAVDAQGRTIVKELKDVVGVVNFNHASVQNSPYRVMHLDILQETLNKMADKNGYTDIDVTIEYVDVDKKPFTQQYANSIYFDGVGRTSQANAGAGPIASMIFALNALSKIGQQQPLDAATKGGSAFIPHITSPRAKVLIDEARATSVTDLCSRKALHLLAQTYPTGKLLDSDLPALYKMVKMRMLVKGPDRNGDIKLMWAEEVIGMEAEAEAAGRPPRPLSDYQIIHLSDSVARTLLGATGTMGVTGAITPMILNLQDSNRFPLLTADRLAQLGLSQIGETVEAADSPLAQVSSLPRSSMSDAKGAAIKSAYRERIRIWSQKSQPFTSYRSEHNRKGKANFDIKRINATADARTRKMLKSEDMASWLHRLKVPYAALQDIGRLLIAKHYLDQLEAARISPTNVHWVYQRGKTSDLSQGLLSEQNLSDDYGGDPQMQRTGVIYGDQVTIDLEAELISTGGNEAQALQQLRGTIKFFSERGVTIQLFSGKGDQYFRSHVAAIVKEEEFGYMPLSGSTHIFVPIRDESDDGATTRALNSTDTATKKFLAKGATLGILHRMKGTRLSENAVYADTTLDPTWQRMSTMLCPTAIMSTGTGRDRTQHMFGIPVPGTGRHDQQAHVADRLLKLLRTDDGRDFLRKLASGNTSNPDPEGLWHYRENKNGTFDPGIRNFDDAMDVLQQTLEANQWPVRRGNTLMGGDIVPIVDQQGNILLTRIGFKIPDYGDLGTQLASKPPTATGADSQNRVGFAVAKPEIEGNQKVTPPFTIIDTYPDPQRGLALMGEYDLDALSKQIWEGAGFKAGLAPLPEGYAFPTTPMAHKIRKDPNKPYSQYGNNTSVTHIASEKDVIGKGATEGIANNFSTLFAIGGADFREDAINYFFGPATSKRSDEEFNTLWNKARVILDQWASLDTGMTAEDIKASMDGGTFMLMAQQEITELAQLKFPGTVFPDLSLGTLGKKAKSTGDASRDIMTRMLCVLAAPGVKVDHVIGTTGLLNVADVNSNSEILVMPTIFTDMLADPSIPHVRAELIRRFNESMPVDDTDPGNPRPLYKMDEQWNFYVRMTETIPGANGAPPTVRELWEPGTLQLILPVPASENAVSYAQSMVASERQGVTQHVTNVINASIGGRIATAPLQKLDKEGKLIDQGPTQVQALFGNNNVMRFGKDEEGTFWNMLTRIEAKDPSYTPWGRLLPLQAEQVDRVAAKVRQYRRVIEKSKATGWSQKQIDDIEPKIEKFLAKLNLQGGGPGARQEVDFLVRQFIGRPGPTMDQTDYEEMISFDLYNQILELMQTNIEEYRNPLHGGVVPLPHMFFWERLYLAQDSTAGKRWGPRTHPGKQKPNGKNVTMAQEWNDWVTSLIGQVRDSNTEFHSMFQDDLDGFWQTYQGATPALGTQQLSMDNMRSLRMLNKETNHWILSMQSTRQAVLDDPIILDSTKVTFDALVGHKAVISERYSRTALASELVTQLTRQKAWLAGKKLAPQKQASMRSYLEEGAYYIESTQTSNALMRNLVNLSITMRLANPALYFSALLEVPFRNSLEHLTNLATGQHIGAGGRTIAAVAEKQGWDSKYSSKEVLQMQQLADSMGHSNAFLSVLYEEMTYQQLVKGSPTGAKSITRILERSAAFAAKASSDPRYGMMNASIAKRYLEAAWGELSKRNTSITVEQFVSEMSHDPLWLQKQYEREGMKAGFNPHRAGMNRVAQVRGTKQTVFAKILMGGFDSMCTAEGPIVSSAGHLLKIPFLFTRFNVNALMTVTGLSAWDQAAAIFFDGRRKPKFLQRGMAKWFGGDYDYEGESAERWDLSDIIETMDLQRTFIRSGITMTMLMQLGMMAGGMGLGGDDEEARRRKRLSENLNIPLFLNPMEAANEFTYKDAIFLDSLPGPLENIFMDESGHQAIIPHWIIRQFTSPIIGMQRFFETGDLRELGHGFLDAFSAVPHSVARIWDSADTTAKLLAEQANSTSLEGTVEAQASTNSLIINIAGVYERALFENSFVNAVRSGADKYDRNPWVVPKTAEDEAGAADTGELDRLQGTNNPQETTALTTYVDDNGQVKQHYVQRNGAEGERFQYAENNATFALVASLFTGLGNSPYLRKNMAIREQTIHMPESTKDQIESMILAAYQGTGGQEDLSMTDIIYKIKKRYEDADVYWNQADVEDEARAIYNAHTLQPLSFLTPEGYEEMTDAGKKGVFAGLRGGTVQLGDASLQGFNASQELRQEIGAEWMTEIIQEGIDHGLSQQSAQYRANRFWYGDPANPDVPGLKWLLFDKKIPSTNEIVYNQLNATYVIGPDGKPWATPFKRQSPLQAVGIPLPTQTWAAADGLHLEEGSGKIIDEAIGINTGLHSLERKQVEADIVATDAPLEEAAAKSYAPSNKPYTRRGGGGSYTPNVPFIRMQPFPGGTGARADDIPFINVSTPYIRRARVERERVTSQRGRLKQWQ